MGPIVPSYCSSEAMCRPYSLMLASSGHWGALCPAWLWQTCPRIFQGFQGERVVSASVRPSVCAPSPKYSFLPYLPLLFTFLNKLPSLYYQLRGKLMCQVCGKVNFLTFDNF